MIQIKLTAVNGIGNSYNISLVKIEQTDVFNQMEAGEIVSLCK